MYRTYRKFELILRIRPRKYLKRDRVGVLAVSEAINEYWSMDLMYDQLDDGRNY